MKTGSADPVVITGGLYVGDTGSAHWLASCLQEQMTKEKYQPVRELPQHSDPQQRILGLLVPKTSNENSCMLGFQCANAGFSVCECWVFSVRILPAFGTSNPKPSPYIHVHSHTLESCSLFCRQDWIHVEVLERFNDVRAHHGHAPKTTLVQDTDVEGWGIEFLLGQVLGG